MAVRYAILLLLVAGWAPHVSGQDVSTLATGFSASGGVLVAPDGMIYVADFGVDGSGTGSSLYQITPEGDVSLFSEALSGGNGGAFNAAGELFWSSFSANRVDRIDASGARSLFASVDGPAGLAFDAEENLIVASCNGQSVLKYSLDGQLLETIMTTLFNCPNGLTIDDEGQIYVSNLNDGSVFRINPALSNLEIIATVPGEKADNLAYADQYVYVTARAAHAIYRFRTDAPDLPTVELFAGQFQVRGNTDGPLDQATFSFPNSISFDPSGRFLYTNDVELGSTTFHPSVLRRIDFGEPGPTGTDDEPAVPGSVGTELDIFPNPVSGQTTFSIVYPCTDPVTTGVFDALGRRIWVDVSPAGVPGRSIDVTWSSAGVAPGAYLVRAGGSCGTGTRTIVVQ